MLAAPLQDALNRWCCPCVRTPGDSLADDHSYVRNPVKVGNFILLYGRRRSSFPHHCMVGPDWPFVVVVFFLIFIVNAVILYVISPLGWPPVLIGVVGALGLLGSYSVVAFSDPGIVYRNEYSENNFSPPPIPSLTYTATVSSAILPTAGDGRINADVSSKSSSSASETDVAAVDDVESGSHERLLPLASASPTLGTGSVSVHQTSIPGPPVISTPPSIAPTRVAFALERTMECGNCLLHRPMTARHCSYCKTCIKELDHHCPW